MENINRIAENLRSGSYSTNPHGCADDVAQLAGEYSFLVGELDGILQSKPSIWSELRKSVKSDTSAERAWEATPAGLKESSIQLRLKSCEKMMSSMKALLRVLEVEAKNSM